MKAVFCATVALLLASTAAATEPQVPATPAARDARGFPAPARPVAGIVSATWGDRGERDRAQEVAQIAERLTLLPGMTVADIGAGDGYDSLRLAAVVGPRGRVIAQDITPAYLDALRKSVEAKGLRNVTTLLGAPDDPKLPAASLDAAIMVHMYHEIAQPYALLYALAPAFKRAGLLGIEELDRGTSAHGTPPALLTCELQAVGYRRVSLEPLKGDLGYFAVFTPPRPQDRPAPSSIRPCRP